MGVRIMGIFHNLSRCALAFAIAASADAAEVYRCDGGNGPVFQDAPCAQNQKQTRIRLAPDPAPPPPTADAAASTAAPGPAPPANAPSAPRAPAPSFFLCTAGDGSQYVNDSGVGRVNWVPYTMVDGHNQSLAEAYGGRNGLASHPSNVVPHRPLSAAPGAGTYVQVVDRCHFAAPAEACAYLRGQLGDLDGKLRRAFSDTEAQLKRERAGVVDQLRGCR